MRPVGIGEHMKLEQINGSNYLCFPNIEEEETEEFEVEILEQNAIPEMRYRFQNGRRDFILKMKFLTFGNPLQRPV